MTEIELRIRRSNSDEVNYVGELLGSGNLARVYAVKNAKHEKNPRLAVKIMKQERQEDYKQLNDEYETISKMRNKLTKSDAKNFPDIVELVTIIDGDSDRERNALLMERFNPDDLLANYLGRQRNLSEPLKWEISAWEIAEKYIRFICELHNNVGLCSPDRKLSDFYYLEDKDRLVVLDWNVVKSREETTDQGFVDLRLFARSWFNLFGGIDESRYSLEDNRLNNISIAGRALLWKIIKWDNLTSDLKRARDNTSTDDVILEAVKNLLKLLRLNPEEISNNLDELQKRTPIQDATQTARSTTELQLNLLPYWELADLWERKTRKHSDVLEVIRRQLDALQTKQTQRVISSLRIVTIAREELDNLKEEGSSRREAWVDNFGHLLTLWSKNATIDNQNELAEILRKIQDNLGTFLSGSPNIEQDIQLIEGLYANLEKQPDNIKETVQSSLLQVSTLREYLYAERELYSGTPAKSLSHLRSAEEHLKKLPDNIRNTTDNLLPQNLTKLRQRLESLGQDDIVAVTDFNNQLDNGNFDKALDRLRLWKESAYLFDTSFPHFEPVRLLQKAQVANDVESMDLALSIERMSKLIPSQKRYPWIQTLLQQALDRYEKSLTERLNTISPIPTNDRESIRIYECLLEFKKSLTNLPGDNHDEQ